MPSLTHSKLLEMLDYNRDTGEFRWRQSPSNNIRAGTRAGVVNSNGYRFMSVCTEKLQASRLAWFYVHGAWPVTDIHFRDNNRDNCAIDNLYELPRREAARFRKKLSNNTSGFKGVSPSGHEGKWQARITWNYRQVNLGGRFDTPEEAAFIYNEAEKRLREAGSVETGNRALAEIILLRRQRAVWKSIQRQNLAMTWASFEDFATDVTNFPKNRFAVAPIDATKPIGRQNWKWSSNNGINPATNRVAYNRAKRRDNQNFYRGKDFQKKYGLTFAEYQQMLEKQNGVCACCGNGETKIQNGVTQMLAVDHNHTTGEVRGLLCNSCNLGIGYFRDDPDLMAKAIAYIQYHRAKPPKIGDGPCSPDEKGNLT